MHMVNNPLYLFHFRKNLKLKSVIRYNFLRKVLIEFYDLLKTELTAYI